MAAHRPIPDAPPRGRREHRKNLTRRELLAAGRRLFAEKGLYDSRIEDLSRQAGIAKGTLYLYFANKEELIEAVVTNGFNELLGHVHRTAQDAATREDAVSRVAEAHLEFFAENPDLMRIFHQVRGLLKFNEFESRSLRGVLSKYLTGLAQVLALHPAARAPRGLNDLEVAKLLFGSISGVASVRASMNGRTPERDNLRATVRALVGLVQAFESPVRAFIATGGERAGRGVRPGARMSSRRGSVPGTSGVARRRRQTRT
jgi:TetR/AcrR family fatty acid metabolism transcriptional regulator